MATGESQTRGEGAGDWTGGPAKWFAVGVLGTLAVAALVWSVVRGVTPAGRGAPPLAEMSTHPAPAGVGRPLAALPEPAEPPAAAAMTKTAERATHADEAPLARTINLNTATAAELELLPGIGPALAQRILDERTTRGAFTSIDDLDRVKGIGPKLLAKLRPHVRVE